MTIVSIQNGTPERSHISVLKQVANRHEYRSYTEPLLRTLSFLHSKYITTSGEPKNVITFKLMLIHLCKIVFITGEKINVEYERNEIDKSRN